MRKLNGRQKEVFDALKKSPATDDELEIRTGLPHQTVSSTRGLLVKLGHIKSTGKKRKTRNNWLATVWKAEKRSYDKRCVKPSGPLTIDTIAEACGVDDKAVKEWLARILGLV